MFGLQSCRNLRDVTDGSSNTIAMAEIATANDGNSIRGGVASSRGTGPAYTNPVLCQLEGNRATGKLTPGTNRKPARKWLGQWHHGLHGSQHSFAAEFTSLPPKQQ